MHSLERRITRLEPSPAGARMFVAEAETEAEADRLFEEHGAAGRDLAIWIRTFGANRPPRLLYSIDIPAGTRGGRGAAQARGDAEL